MKKSRSRGGVKRKHPGNTSESENNKKKCKSAAACVGVIRLDYNYPPAQGDIDCPDSFDCDVHYETVPGLTFKMCKEGKMTKKVKKRFKKSIKWLVEEKNVNAITGDCGFMMNFQRIARQVTKIPVFMNSLCQLPAVTRGYAENEQIIILTANRKDLEHMKDLIKVECDVDTQDTRYNVVGCEDVPEFGEEVAKGEKVKVENAQPWIIRKAFHTLLEYPQSRAFLLECTELSPYANAIRFYTGLPVFNSITACQFFISGSKDIAIFGLQDWPGEWDSRQDRYHFGDNLVESESFSTFVTMRSLARILQKKNKSGESLEGNQKENRQGSTSETGNNNKEKKIAAPRLGVIRLDYDYPPAPGDIDSPDSFDCYVYYKVVPGLTFKMCKEGKMTPQVEKRFKNFIKWLVEKTNVNAITGDCGFMINFQSIARQVTKIPVFMSSLCQLPAITGGYEENEQFIILTANGKDLKHMSVAAKDKRYNIVGCEDVPKFGEAVAKGEKVKVEDAGPWIVRKAFRALLKYPKSKAFLLECTELPPYANAIRFYTGLPVFDAITACHFFISGSKDEAMFGLQDWQDEWDGTQKPYHFGDNLTESEKEELVNPIHSDKLKAKDSFSSYSG